MSDPKRSPMHTILDESHPLSKELYSTLLGSTSTNSRRLYDVSSLTENPKLFKKVIEFLRERYSSMGSEAPTHVMGVESRGYLIGAPLALALGIPFVLVRVTKRFPGSFVREDNAMSNLPRSRSIRHNSITSNSRVLVLDDFVSTGQSLISAMRLCNIVGAKIVEVTAVCDIPYFDGIGAIRKVDDGLFKDTPIFILMHFLENREALRAQLQSLSSCCIKARL